MGDGLDPIIIDRTWVLHFSHQPRVLNSLLSPCKICLGFFMRCCSPQTNLVCCSFSQQPVRVLYAIGHTHSLCCCSSPHVLCITVILVHCNIMLVQHYTVLLIHVIHNYSSVLAVALSTNTCGLQQQHNNTVRIATIAQ